MEERAAKLECKDNNDKCQEWAASGQCQANRVYMVSSHWQIWMLNTGDLASKCPHTGTNPCRWAIQQQAGWALVGKHAVCALCVSQVRLPS